MIDLKRDLTAKEVIWYRHAIGLTQQEVADILGVSRQTINNLEHGYCKISRMYSICYQLIYEYLIPEENRLIHEEIANLGLNCRDVPVELVEAVKTKIKGA